MNKIETNAIDLKNAKILKPIETTAAPAAAGTVAKPVADAPAYNGLFVKMREAATGAGNASLRVIAIATVIQLASAKDDADNIAKTNDKIKATAAGTLFLRGKNPGNDYLTAARKAAKMFTAGHLGEQAVTPALTLAALDEDDRINTIVSNFEALCGGTPSKRALEAAFGTRNPSKAKAPRALTRALNALAKARQAGETLSDSERAQLREEITTMIDPALLTAWSTHKETMATQNAAEVKARDDALKAIAERAAEITASQQRIAAA